MGKIGSALGSAVGAGLGSFWGKDRAGDAARVGHDVGGWLPFKKGGYVKSYANWTIGSTAGPVVRGGRKKKIVAASRGALIAPAPQILRRR